VKVIDVMIVVGEGLFAAALRCLSVTVVQSEGGSDGLSTELELELELELLRCGGGDRWSIGRGCALW
jgi:hypothetical protein